MRNFVRLAAMAATVCVFFVNGCGGVLGEGERGPQGSQGEPGMDGVPGTMGPAGTAGQDGIDGADGAPGPTGPQGEPGIMGAQGEPGAPGQPGAPGRDGMDGFDGRDGQNGQPGLACWDLDGDAFADTDSEDTNEDGRVDVLDCRGQDGRDGEDGQNGMDGRDGEDGQNGADGRDGQNGQPAEGEGEEPEPECVAGTEGCPCYGNLTCNDALECAAEPDGFVCRMSDQPEPEPCPNGTAWCQCYDNDTCNEGLNCEPFQNVCVPRCSQIGCPCDQDDEDGCDNGLLCARAPWAGGMYFCDADTDEDGIADMTDNCPMVANSDQEDLDGDVNQGGGGDACDGDVDGDDVPNRADHCPRFWDQDNACPCQPNTLADPHDAAEVAACYSGLNATRGVGQCREGTRRCEFNENTQAITWSACTGEVLPVAEVCSNGLDENCNGVFDDGCQPAPECNPGAVRACGNPAVGQCRQGQQTCGNDSRWAACVNEVRPQNEICGNGLDEDCDAVADDGCPAGGGPGPNGGTETHRFCVPADPGGTWTLNVWNDPQGGVFEVAAGQCVERALLASNRMAARANARRPNAGLYCAGWVNNPNDVRDTCPGFRWYVNGVQQSIRVVSDATGINYQVVS